MEVYRGSSFEILSSGGNIGHVVSLIKTGNCGCLGVRNECHIAQNFLMSEVIECVNLQSLHGIIHLATDETQTQPRIEQDTRDITDCESTDLLCKTGYRPILTLQSRFGID